MPREIIILECTEARGEGKPVSRYVSTAVAEREVNLHVVSAELVSVEQRVRAATEKHNAFLKELGLPLLPVPRESRDHNE